MVMQWSSVSIGRRPRRYPLWRPLVVVVAVVVVVGAATVVVVGTVVMTPDVVVVEASVVDVEDVVVADAPPSPLHAASTSISGPTRATHAAGPDRCTRFMAGTS